MRASGYIEYRRIGPLRPAPAAAAVFLCAALVCAAAAGRAGERVNDVVILRGGDVPGLAGTPLERIGGFAVKDGRLDAVPFQIDERDERGQLIYTKFGGGTTARPDGILGAADEILFMYRDAGGRRGGEALPPGAAAAAEIKVSDPSGGDARWFYILSFGGKAPRSAAGYVNYCPEKDLVVARYYTLGFPYRKAIQVPSYFALNEAAGGNGRNIYDIYKLRLTLDLKIFGKATWTQDDFIVTPVGYVDGPVRVSRRVSAALRLAGPFRSATISSDSAYYPYYCQFPSLLQIPFPLSSVARAVTMRVTDDLSAEAKGMTWSNERNPGGIPITGTPGEKAAALDRGEFRWKMARGPQGAVMMLTLFDPRMSMLGKELFYIDDESAPDEPCQFKGQIANSGYMLFNIESLPKGNYDFTVYVFCLPHYKAGDEAEAIDSVLRPLEVSASPLAPAR